MSVPRPKTRFFGRVRDLDELERAVTSGAPFVTLWGPPGIGKTRLAIELCRRSSRAWFCDLSAARDANEMCACVLRALDAEPSFDIDPRRVGLAIAARAPSVVVLDGFEHLAQYATAILGEWIDVAPQVTFMTTSRTRLRVGGEVALEIGPLPEARDLLLDRVGAATAERLEREDVDELLARVEGIPLAIELAAARVDVIGIRELLDRIDRPLEVLDRERTLERTIDSSIRSLTREERRVFEQCAVFRDAFGAREVEAVVESEVSVLDALQTLRERSLLRCVSEGGSVRFAFFESIRARASNALRESGEELGARRRHALHYLAMPSCDPANLADALSWALEDAVAGRAFAGEAVAALARMDPSMLTDALLARLGQALALVSEDCDRLLRARGHRVRARALLLRGDEAEARADLERALSLAADDESLAAELWADIGVLDQKLGDLNGARACYEKALTLGHDKLAHARFVGDLGAVAHDLGQMDEALRRYEEAIAVFRACGQRELEGTFLANLAVLLQEMGASPRARATFHMALERLELTGARRMEAIARTNLGLLCHEIGELEEARSCHEQALALLRQVTDARSEALCLGRLAMTLAALGRHREAATRCERAESILRDIEDWCALEVLELFRAYVEWMRSRNVALTRERLLHARALSARSDDARTTTRLIESTLASQGSSTRVLVVGPKASFFSPPDGEPCDLSHRQVLRRLLLLLVQRHRAAPGVGVTLDDLRGAGWPDEHTALTALNRVHVALTELRRRGLRSCLQREGSRYLIDPAVRIELREAVTARPRSPSR